MQYYRLLEKISMITDLGTIFAYYSFKLILCLGLKSLSEVDAKIDRPIKGTVINLRYNLDLLPITDIPL